MVQCTRHQLYAIDIRSSNRVICLAVLLDRTGLEFAFVVMRSGWCSTPFLRALRHSISIAGPVPRVDAASRAASAAIGIAILVHHITAPPASRPRSTSPPAPDIFGVGPPGGSQGIQAPGPCRGPPVGPSYASPRQQIDEWVAGPSGKRHRVPQGGPYDSRRPSPGGIAPEGKMGKMAEPP
jgi:hypothetical protein